MKNGKDVLFKSQLRKRKEKDENLFKADSKKKRKREHQERIYKGKRNFKINFIFFSTKKVRTTTTLLLRMGYKVRAPQVQAHKSSNS